jgi:hypothetical protein
LEHHRDPPESHIGRLVLEPGLQMRFELAAMRAAVREELDHLDVLAGVDRNILLEAHVLTAFGQALRAGACGKRRGNPQHGDETPAKGGEDRVTTHAHSSKDRFRT